MYNLIALFNTSIIPYDNLYELLGIKLLTVAVIITMLLFFRITESSKNLAGKSIMNKVRNSSSTSNTVS